MEAPPPPMKLAGHLAAMLTALLLVAAIAGAAWLIVHVVAGGSCG